MTNEKRQQGGSWPRNHVLRGIATLMLPVGLTCATAVELPGDPAASDVLSSLVGERHCVQAPVERLPHVRRLTEPGPPLSVGPAARSHVDAWRRRLLNQPEPLLRAYLLRPERWRHRLLPILRSHGVPSQFLYLALIESGMDSTAHSPAEALGLWQITEETALTYDLSVEEAVDERRDPSLATELAARYLRQLYREFGSWELAAAAYNAGPARVRRALDRSGAYSFWELAEERLLPPETRDYVPKLMAVVELAAEVERFPRSEASAIHAD